MYPESSSLTASALWQYSPSEYILLTLSNTPQEKKKKKKFTGRLKTKNKNYGSRAGGRYYSANSSSSMLQEPVSEITSRLGHVQLDQLFVQESSSASYNKNTTEKEGCIEDLENHRTTNHAARVEELEQR